MTHPITSPEDALAAEGQSFLTPTQVETLLLRVQDPDPYTRLDALRRLLEGAAPVALPLLDSLSRTDPVSTIRHFCRTELEARARRAQAVVETPSSAEPPVSLAERRHERRMAIVYQLFGVAFILTGVFLILNADAQGNYDPNSYVVRFLRQMPIAHILAGGLCFLTAQEVPSQRFESYVLKWLTSLLILLSYPFGPFVGGWMIFHLMKVGQQWRRISS